MIFRNATQSDIPAIASLETTPEFRTYVGAWPEDRHLKMLDDPDAAYLVVEDSAGSIAGFAVLLGLGSEHKSIELKRIVVDAPNRGLGRKLLKAVVEKAFDEHGAPVTTALSERIIGIPAEQLRQVDEIIAVAYGTSKAAAVRAAVRGGFVTDLITHSSLAERLLELS